MKRFCQRAEWLLQLYTVETGLLAVSLHIFFFYLLRGRGFRGRGRGGRMSRGVMRGGRGMMKGFGPPGHGRGRLKDGAMNGFAPMRY